MPAPLLWRLHGSLEEATQPWFATKTQLWLWRHLPSHWRFKVMDFLLKAWVNSRPPCSHFHPGQRGRTSSGGPAKGLWLVQTQYFICLMDCCDRCQCVLICIRDYTMTGATQPFLSMQELPRLVQIPLPRPLCGYVSRLSRSPPGWLEDTYSNRCPAVSFLTSASSSGLAELAEPYSKEGRRMVAAVEWQYCCPAGVGVGRELEAEAATTLQWQWQVTTAPVAPHPGG
jgi:hypothetical protein